MKLRHFLSLTDVSKDEIIEILNISSKLKKELKTTGRHQEVFINKTLAMLFEKPSLRTRVSFETGMTQLGGHAIYLASQDIGLGKREPIKDVAIVASSMTDMIMARVFKHETVTELAKNSSVPVINGLSNLEHPCQTLADLLTIQEKKETLQGITIAFFGDSENNVVHSLALAAGLFGMHLTTCSPKGYWMWSKVVEKAEKLAHESGGSITQTDDPTIAAKDVDIVYTDTWVSMGEEAEKEQRQKIFQQYQVTQDTMNQAKPDALFMHDMPAYRGQEVTNDVIDGPQSVIYQQAENRLHAQKGLLVFLQNEQ